MIGRSPDHWVGKAARRTVALLTVIALLLAPMIVILTHGPAAHATLADTAADEAEPHGHDACDTGPGPMPGHDATDHDHPLHAVVGKPVGLVQPVAALKRCGPAAAFRGLTRDGPDRPPRAV